MRLSTRKLLDRSFSALGLFAIVLMAIALAVILAPIFWRGAGAFVFRATVEHRKMERTLFLRGDEATLNREIAEAEKARQPVYECLGQFSREQDETLNRAIEAVERLGRNESSLGRRIERAGRSLRELGDLEKQVELLTRLESVARREADEAMTADLDVIAGALADLDRNAQAYGAVAGMLRELLGPLPGDPERVMPREQFGQTRWERAQVKRDHLLWLDRWDYSDRSVMGVAVRTPRREQYKGTALYPIFDHIENRLEAMLLPRRTFYWRFLTDVAHDAHFFGGIGPEALGTFYLTFGAMLFAVPLGVMAAIYFTEYSRPGRLVSLLRTCVSTLAGVPSIVFGLFGLAFFIYTLRVSPSKSVLAGALTLGLLILPTVIRAAEEAILAVPQTYKEAAMSLGAGRWRTVVTVILPAALPGILTGVVISMGRAAGETAPIIFTAAVSVGAGLWPWEVFNNPTPALSWNIYNLATEHEAVDQIRHVQYGMVTVLVGIVLLLNLSAIALRAKISKKLRG
jgi:phosphate transport system permease protein